MIIEMSTTKSAPQPPPLKESHFELLRVFAELETKLGRRPSLRLLMSKLDGLYSNPSSIKYALEALQERGFIRPLPVDPGGITEDGRALLRTGKRARPR